MSQWASLHCHDYLSLLDGLSSPLDNFTRAVEGNLAAIAITNHGNMSSVVKLQKARKQYIDKTKSLIDKTSDNDQKDILCANIDKAKSLKLIFGNEMYLAVGEKENAHLVVLAKNLQGYRRLIKATSESSRRENFYRKPRLTLDKLSEYAGDLVVIDGHPGSALYKQIWIDEKASFGAKTYEDARGLVHPDWKKRILEHIGKFKDAFGDNYKLESQLIDAERIPAARVAVNIYRWAAKQTNTQVVATEDPHYPTKERSIDQQVLLVNAMKTTIPKVRYQLANDEDDVGLSGFFLSDKYYVHSSEEICGLYPEEEIRASLEIAESCEEYSLASKPVIPKFDCPDGMSSDDYFKHLCREGWKEKLSHLRGSAKQEYGDRVKNELEVLQGAGLSDYFLLMWDIVNWVKANNGLVGIGRGSAGGCLTAYLTGLIALDPVDERLLFERFYNAGRNDPTSGHVEYPDFDLDIQASFRDKVIAHIKEKHGKTHVAQIATYGRMMGRSCLSDVLRAHECIPFDEIKRCTKFIPDEAAISDDLQEMREESGEASIIIWALENNAKELSEWCSLDKNGDMVGPLADYFRQAVRLEGTYRTKGKHAAGIIIYPEDIEDHFPVTYSGDGEMVIDFDLKDSEYAGGLKMDILGVTGLDVIKDCEKFVQDEFLLDYEDV